MQHSGSCLCGAVTFTVDGQLAAPDGCHCTACRKTSGHFFASTDIPRSSLKVMGSNKITWFKSSSRVRRGFCSACGSPLFWDPDERDWIGIAMGAFDGPTDTHLHVHVHTAEKGDYYRIEDGGSSVRNRAPTTLARSVFPPHRHSMAQAHALNTLAPRDIRRRRSSS